MATVVAKLFISHCDKLPVPDESDSRTRINNEEHDHSLEQLTHRVEPPFYLIYGNGRSLFL